ELVTDPYLTKADLLRLYGECGNVLHRGNLKNFIRENMGNLDLSPIREWIAKIATLLNHHQIQLADKNKQMWVVMKSKDDGRTYTHIFGKLYPDPYSCWATIVRPLSAPGLAAAPP